ncbi:ABC transporter permease [Methylocapsa sp. S129]|uniref:ABC transporter permease n=1 Tax=Methylocapsa sp. S129 TaxID=1641869 RepID=UPI00131DDDCB|nr:ABC transporter permease [Methylocapsa sp. S129]
MTSPNVRQWVSSNAWVWSYAGAFLVFVAMLPFTSGHGVIQTTQVALQFSTFYVMVGLGQMLVIALGNGNIDLSIPGVITLGGFVGLGAGGDGPWGAATAAGATLLVGISAGLVNAIPVRILRIPPMIATLSSGFVFQSVAIAYSRGASAAPPALLADVTTHRSAGVPDLTIIFVFLSVVVAFTLRCTKFGRTILALGQNARAAGLTGLRVGPTITFVYIISSTFAAFTGLLLAASVGGASLDMGQDYLLFSIAVVVLGGAAISGGRASTAGVWGAGLLLVLSVTLLNVIGVSVGVRFLVTGLIIVLVLGLANRRA